MTNLLRSLALALLLVPGLSSFPTAAAIFLVDSEADTADAVLDGICDVDPGAGIACTLRAAIQEANSLAGLDTIQLDAIGTRTVLLASSLPAITSPLAISNESGDRVTIDGGDAVRIFFVNADFDLRDVRLRNGRAQGGAGGRTSFGGGGGGAAGMGGAIFVNSGTVTLEDVEFASNEARGGDGGSDLGTFAANGGGGGGVASDGADSGAGPAPGGSGGPLGAEGQGGAGGTDDASDGAPGGSFGGGGGGGGGSRNGGMGLFGGGGGGGGDDFGGPAGSGGAGGSFAGAGADGSTSKGGGGGGGAGLGGALFVRSGTTILHRCVFLNNTASGGSGSTLGTLVGADGEGKGGAIFAHVAGGASVIDVGGLGFLGNVATHALALPSDNDNTFGTSVTPVALSAIELD